MIDPRHTVSIEYCVPCGYRERALGLAGEVLEAWAPVLVEVVLKTGSKGCFEVLLDGEQVFSKAELGRFPEPGEVGRSLEPRLGPPVAGK